MRRRAQRAPTHRRWARNLAPLAAAILVASAPARAGDPTNVDVVIDIASCGNGIVEAGEACDDGNLSSGDGCSASCGCSLTIYRDLPRWTHLLDDWPQENQCPRSPKYVFGKERIISMTATLADMTPASVTVDVTNATTGSTVPVVLGKVGGVYRNLVPSEDLYLRDQTVDDGTGDFVHVREEEVLDFVLREDPTCNIDWMVDRGEAAAATPKDQKVGDEKNGAMEQGFVDAATAYMDGTAGFDPLTTPWWDVGQKLRATCADPYGPFVLAAGDDDPDDKEADILHVGGHSHVTGHLSGGDPGIDAMCTHFRVARSGLYRKNGSSEFPDVNKDGEFTDPSSAYWGSGGSTTTRFADPAQWDADMDWAMLYSCFSLNDTPFDTGTNDFAVTEPEQGGNGTADTTKVGNDVQVIAPPNAAAPGAVIVSSGPDKVLDTPAAAGDTTDWQGIGNVTGAERPWERWKVAFTGARRLHGIMGYKGTGTGSTKIQGVIEKWVALVKGGKAIPRAWLKVTRDAGDVGAIVFVPRDLPDTIDTMQRDPCPDDEVRYWSSGRTDGSKKKIVKGKFKAVGKRPTDDPDFPVETIYTLSFQGTPDSTLLGGQCSVWLPLPSTSGSFPRLELQRSEQPTVGSPYTLDPEGRYSFDLNSEIPLVANSVTGAQAEQAVRDSLAAGFASVPVLDTFGVFPGSVQSDISSFESTFEVELEQRHLGLTVFDSEVYALVTPDGDVDLADVVFYDVTSAGSAMAIQGALTAATTAATDLLANHPDVECELSDMQAFYGHALPVSPGVEEVRPVWGIEFNLGEAIYTIDAVNGTILSEEVAP